MLDCVCAGSWLFVRLSLCLSVCLRVYVCDCDVVNVVVCLCYCLRAWLCDCV